MRIQTWLTGLCVYSAVTFANAQPPKPVPPRPLADSPAVTLPEKKPVVEEKSTASTSPALIKVKVAENATIWFENQKMSQTGGVRIFQSPGLEPKKTYYYKIKVAWPSGSGTAAKEVSSEQEVAVRAGETTTIDFTAFMNHSMHQAKETKPTSTRDLIRQAAHSTPAPDRKSTNK